MGRHEDLYRLLSWLSPSYPVGAFSYSHGLEYAVESGRITGTTALTDWIETVLLLGAGRNDAVFFRESYRATAASDWFRLSEMSELANAFQPTAEIALETRAQGNAFLRATYAVWPAPLLRQLERGAVYPIAVGMACAAHDIDLEDALHAYLHSFAANLVSAGVRLIPLGQTDGQTTLARLEPAVAAAARQGLSLSLDDIGSAAPLIDLASMLHETQYTRLFRS